jgi:hypothetical protein
LLFWNDENWEEEGKYGVGIDISFKSPWIFKILGYRLRSGNKNFLKRWQLIGYKTEHGKSDWNYTYLDKQENNSDLSRKNAEKSFPIQCDEFFDTFKFDLFANSEWKTEFCLNAIEIFGILQKVE